MAGRLSLSAAVTVDYYHECGLFHHSTPMPCIKIKTISACKTEYYSHRVNMARDFHGWLPGRGMLIYINY